MTEKENKTLPNIIINGKGKNIKNWKSKDILQQSKNDILINKI
jgi:tRNA G37 N-methylase TrmD